VALTWQGHALKATLLLDPAVTDAASLVTDAWEWETLRVPQLQRVVLRLREPERTEVLGSRERPESWRQRGRSEVLVRTWPTEVSSLKVGLNDSNLGRGSMARAYQWQRSALLARCRRLLRRAALIAS